MDDEELDALRRRKMAEMQHQAAGDQQAAVREAAAAAQERAAKDTILRQILEPEARDRLERVRLTRPDVAESLENQLVALAQQGRLQRKVDDELLRQFLARVAPKSRDIKIERR